MIICSKTENNNIEVIKIKKVFLLSVISALAFLVYDVYGNIFLLSYALKQSYSICEKKYNGNLHICGAEYLKSENKYVIHTQDINGIRSNIVFDNKNKIITDFYSKDYISVYKNIRRGRISKLLDNANINCNTSIDVKNSTFDIIGSEVDIMSPIDIKLLIFDEKREEELAKLILLIKQALDSENYEQLTVISPHNGKALLFESKKEEISNNHHDISARFKEVINFSFG